MMVFDAVSSLKPITLNSFFVFNVIAFYPCLSHWFMCCLCAIQEISDMSTEQTYGAN